MFEAFVRFAFSAIPFTPQLPGFNALIYATSTEHPTSSVTSPLQSWVSLAPFIKLKHELEVLVLRLSKHTLILYPTPTATPLLLTLLILCSPQLEQVQSTCFSVHYDKHPRLGRSFLLQLHLHSHPVFASTKSPLRGKTLYKPSLFPV